MSESENCAVFVGEYLANTSDKTKCGSCCFCTLLIFILTIISVSIEGVEPTQWGLVMNNINQSLKDVPVKDGGLNWVGLTNSIKRYPSTIQTIEFSNIKKFATAGRLATRTKEGLELKISCSVQYRLIKNDLPKLYRLFEMDFNQKLTRIARNGILMIASEFTAPEFWKKREVVGDSILKFLQDEYKNAYAEVIAFNLLKIDLPTQYNNAIVATEVMTQEQIKFAETRRVMLTK